MVIFINQIPMEYMKFIKHLDTAELWRQANIVTVRELLTLRWMWEWQLKMVGVAALKLGLPDEHLLGGLCHGGNRLNDAG